MNVTECSGKGVEDNYLNAVQMSLETDSTTYCKCTRRCKLAKAFVHYQVAGKDPHDTVLTVRQIDEFLILYEARLIYDVTSLLCEIGGNLGLNLGLSILSLVQLKYTLIRLITHKKKYLPTDPIYQRVVQAASAIFDDSNIQERKQNKSCLRPKHLFKGFIFALCSAISCWFIVIRLEYFLSDPTRMLVEATEQNPLEYPLITVCGDSNKIGIEKVKLARKLRVPREDCPSQNFELLDILPRMDYNVSTLWMRSSNFEYFIDLERLFRLMRANVNQKFSVSNKTVVLPDGTCTQFRVGERHFFGSTSGHLMARMENKQFLGCRKDYSTIYIHHPGDPIDLKAGISHLVGFFGFLTINKIEIHNLNTITNPCVDTKEFHFCVNGCIDRQLERSINCSLPYQSNWIKTKFPECKTIPSAKASHKAYHRIALTTDWKEDCLCIRRCKTTLYSLSYFFEKHAPEVPVTLCGVSYYSNLVVRFVETHAYSFTSFLCEIGGFLGITLGLSLLSIVDVIHKLVVYLKISFLRYSHEHGRRVGSGGTSQAA